jgi:hypothetical protein
VKDTYGRVVKMVGDYVEEPLMPQSIESIRFLSPVTLIYPHIFIKNEGREVFVIKAILLLDF